MSKKSTSILKLLAQYESRNVTYRDPDGGWPIVWERASGTRVWDVEGKEYLDLTAAFGVAAAGHAHPEITQAAEDQIRKLPHAMGDVHPHSSKAQLVQALSRITFERWTHGKRTAKTILCNSGFEAVEAALKTALLATGSPGVLTFKKAYHGLGYGTLNATHRDHFVQLFRPQLKRFGHPMDYPVESDQLKSLFEKMDLMRIKHRIGAVLVEPIQARGGIRIPCQEFLPQLREWCDRYHILLLLDEIYTGMGRTGEWFACENTGTLPDLICLGKALTGGFPLSACVGRADLMDKAWPVSEGEAIHTSTFLGNPVGCTMALAQIQLLKKLKAPELAARQGQFLLKKLHALALKFPKNRVLARGQGLMAGLELRTSKGQPDGETCIRAVKGLLKDGFLFLPEGDHGEVLSWTPPLIISETELTASVDAASHWLSNLIL